MRTNKARVFRAAQKRGIPVEVVRKMLAVHGAPPTLSEMPAKRKKMKIFSPYLGHDITITVRDARDYRDISSDFANEMIKRMTK